MKNPNEMDDFFVSSKLKKLSLKELFLLNKEGDWNSNKNFLTKMSRPRWIHSRLVPKTQIRTATNLSKTLQETGIQGTLPNLFYEASIILISKLTKKQASKQERYSSISLIKTDGKYYQT